MERPLHPPLKQPLDRYSRRRLGIGVGFDKCDEMSELIMVARELTETNLLNYCESDSNRVSH
jgi:hypothetical protein